MSDFVRFCQIPSHIIILREKSVLIYNYICIYTVTEDVKELVVIEYSEKGSSRRGSEEQAWVGSTLWIFLTNAKV